MANGDEAAARGMAVVPSTADAKLGFDEINLTRDYVATYTNAVQPVAEGGTGATTPAQARTNLGIPPFSPANTGNALVQRNADGNASISTPISGQHIANKSYVDQTVTGLAGTAEQLPGIMARLEALEGIVARLEAGR